jgi:hypothetical protein
LDVVVGFQLRHRTRFCFPLPTIGLHQGLYLDPVMETEARLDLLWAEPRSQTTTGRVPRT